jgi:hypothetical protein
MRRGTMRVLWAVFVGGLVFQGWAGPAAAQYQYGPPPPPPSYYYPPAPGTSWVGSGQMLNAYGNLGISQEQARIMSEQAAQAKLQTKKQTIDTMGYERAHKYWYSDEKADDIAKQVQAAVNSPPLAEITSGRALNTLLTYMDQLINTGKRGPNAPLDPNIVKQLNINVGDGGNAGMLAEFGNIEWPPILICKEQKKLDASFKTAISQAKTGKVSNAVIRDITKETEALQTVLKSRFGKDEFDASDWLDGSHFIDRISSATTALRSPNVTKVLSGQMAPTGYSVGELVENMASKGMTFARAQPGQEDAYVAVHRAMANFALGIGGDDTGFRIRLSGVAGQ